jgi:stage IV sporulation protein FB
MDGGRILRAALALRGSPERATRIAAGAGQFFAVAMGLAGLLWGNFFLVFIAMFVWLGAAQEGASARASMLSTGYPVSAAMITDYRTLSHGQTVRDAGNLLLATSQHDFPVLHGEQVIGLLNRSALVRAMLTDGPDAYVSGVIARDFPRVTPDMPLTEAIPLVSAPNSCALVMDGDRLLGMLTAENLSEFLLLRQVSMAQARPQPE